MSVNPNLLSHLHKRKGFSETLIRLGMVVGFWIAVADVAAFGFIAACALGAFVTVLSAGVLAWDVWIARKGAS